MSSLLSAPLTIQQIIGRFRREKPKDADEALHNCRVPMQYLFSGAFRHVYHIVGAPVVAKFPHDDDMPHISDSVDHSTVEVTWIRRLRAKKYKALHPYLPRVYYFDPKNGTVMMHKYAALENNRKTRRLCGELELQLTRDLGLAEADIKTDNMGRDENGNIVILDFGCFT